MRAACAFVWVASLALAQPGDTQWRRDLMGLPDHPTGATAQEVDRFVQNVQMATPYFASITPGDFEANREMVRRMWAYTMALEMMAKQNPVLRPYASRARGAMNAFPIGYMMVQAPPSAPGFDGPPKAAAAQQQDKPVPFSLTAPNRDNADLASRYDSTAARAATTWKNAETMRQSLVARGMNLNAQTAASVSRLQGDMDAAARALESRKWDEATASLDRADAEIEKISKVAGH